MASSISEAQTRSPGEKESADLLSDLPEDVGLKILERLPLQDAVRTSILSTSWKHKWASLPHIVLDQEFFSTVVARRVETSDRLTRFTNIISNVIHRHVGLIRKLVLYVPHFLAKSNNICELLRFLSRKSVRILTLNYAFYNFEKLAPTMFLFARLTHLTLRYCTISTLPPTFTGFPNLLSLELFTCTWELPNVLETFICSCPQLQLLRFDAIMISNLTIHAPNLEHLFLEGFVGKLCIGKRTSKIRTMDRDFVSATPCVIDFSPLPVLQTLRVGHTVFQYDLGRLETQSLVLISIALYYPTINRSALNLLGNIQHLQRLFCEVSQSWIYDYKAPPMFSCDHYDFEDQNLPSLKHVGIDNFLGTSSELEFIKRVLEGAPVLEVMTIKFSEHEKVTVDRLNVAMKLMQLPRASKDSQINFINLTE